MNKLKPCPFCGSVLDLLDRDVFHPSGGWKIHKGFRSYLSFSDLDKFDGFTWQINCPTIYGGCGASISGDSEEEAVEAWNKRKESND